MRINKLWQKLAVSFVVMVLTITLVTLFWINLAFRSRFNSYIRERRRLERHRIVGNLALEYLVNSGWTGHIKRVLAPLAENNRVKLKLVDARGSLVAAAAPESESLREATFNRKPDKVAIMIGADKVGTVFIYKLKGAAEVPPEDIRFRASINQLLLLSGLTAVILALLVSYLIATRLTAPLAEINKAVENIETGNLAYRAPITGDDEINELARVFNHLAAALERQEELRQNLTADISHELRTPLTTIRSHIEAYLDGVIKPNAENLRSIHEEIIRLTRLVADLGEIARVESGQVVLRLAKVNPAEIVKKAAAALKLTFQEKKIALTIGKQKPVLLVKADSDKLYQVFYNLLHNAWKYTPAGGNVSVEMRRRGREVEISFQDNGIGIDKDKLPLVFERFYRVEKSRGRDLGGAGIGLSVVKALVKAHNGRVAVESEPGRGSKFTVILPLV